MSDLSKLAPALLEAQKAFKKPQRTSENPYHKSSYADLEETWEACKNALHTNGLIVTQTFRSEGELPILVTRLLHTSGQTLESSIPVIAAKKDPQGYGSAITYFRRYSLQALLCLVASDDDGEQAQGREVEKPAPQKVQPKAVKPAAELPIEGGKFAGRLPSQIETREIQEYLIEIEQWLASQNRSMTQAAPALQTAVTALENELRKRKK